jgi:hypothetical protein
MRRSRLLSCLISLVEIPKKFSTQAETFPYLTYHMFNHAGAIYSRGVAISAI